MSATGFIVRAACRGRRPSQLASCVVQSRSMLVAQLLRNRDVARCIVAPSGYGKSYLALEYAETMKSWQHTFWINAQSPCFMRELDAGVFAAYILEVDAESPLVIIDDLPMLDAGRQMRLSQEIDLLLSKGSEVIVSCVPTCDTLGSLQPDRLTVRSSSLLLNDSELDEARSAEDRLRKPANELSTAWRIPLFAWSHEKTKGELFVRGILAEELPGDLLFIMISALVLRKGWLSSLLSLGSYEKHVLQELVDDYPHLGIDDESDMFETPLVSIDELAGPLRKHLARLVTSSSFETTEQLVYAWASTLLAGTQAARACEVIQELCPYSYRAAWIVDNATELVRQACFVSTFRLITSLGSSTGDMRYRLDAFEGLCRRVLGDEPGAIRCAKKCAFDARCPEDARTLGLLLVARLNGGRLTSQACGLLEERGPGDEAGDIRCWSKWELLEEAWRAQATSPSDLAHLWMRYYEAEVEDDVLSICASWYFTLFDGSGDEMQQSELLACRQMERYVRCGLSGVVGQPVADYYLVSAGLSMEDAHAYGLAFEDGPLETKVLIMLRRVEMSIVAQRRYFEEDERIAQARRDDWVTTHPASLSGMAAGAHDVPERTIPLLELKMFGCFEATIGGVPLEQDRFKRQNTRVLLVLLAVNQGKELSRDIIAEKMWPRSSLKVARKNYYAVWSHLRKALSLPDGTCPYLVRHRYGCSLDSRLVHSDVERLNEICRDLLFGSPNVDRWSLLFAEIDRDFSSDLMPAETDNQLIVQARNDLRTRLVDALVSATESIISADTPQWGVWFARAALGHDDTREDAYVALMRAQIAVNQRTAAMMTYLKCRRILADKLGIDPSPETTALYESLLDAE